MSQTMTFQRAINQALLDEMAADDSVFVFGLDVPDHKRIFGSTEDLVEEYGKERCFGTPISEEAMTGVAIGAAMNGLRPVHVHIRADFMMLAMNQIVNMMSNVSYFTQGALKVPLVIRAVIGRGWGQGAQHSKSMQGVFAHFPGLKVIMPTSPQDAYSLLRSSIQDDGPVIFLEHRWLYYAEDLVDTDEVMPLGQSLVRRKGADITWVTSSWMTVEALQAATILARSGVEVEVVDVRSVRPLNVAPITQSVKKTGRCLIADYDWLFGGLGAEIAARIQKSCFGNLDSPIERIGFQNTPCPTTRPLENSFYPSAQDLIRKTEEMLDLAPITVDKDVLYSWENRFKGPF